ncbi:MAG: HD domain-containing protein, partial [Burkholderiales bacterium]
MKVHHIETEIQSERWLDALIERFAEPERTLVRRAQDYAVESYGDDLHPSGEKWIDHARGTASVIGALRMDADALASALLLGMPSSSPALREALERAFGTSVAALVRGVASMAPIQALRARAALVQRSSDKAAQLEALRKMLLAMVQDVRVVVLKLADQVQVLRYLVGRGDAAACNDAANDT